MNEVDLLSIGSYTELPGGNIALPSGYSGILAPILKVPVVQTLLYRQVLHFYFDDLPSFHVFASVLLLCMVPKIVFQKIKTFNVERYRIYFYLKKSQNIVLYFFVFKMILRREALERYRYRLTVYRYPVQCCGAGQSLISFGPGGKKNSASEVLIK